MFVESWVKFNSVTQVLVPYEVGEFVWPLIWVIVLAGLSLRVAVLTSGACPGGGGSSSGWRVLRCVLRFVEQDSCVEPPRLPSRSSGSSLSVMDLAATIVLVLGQLQAD